MNEIEALREALRTDTPLYAETALKIIDPAQRLVPLVPRPAQLRFDAALERQRQEGRPIRAIVLKARKLGFSTWVAAKMMQTVTQTPHHKAAIVAHDLQTSGELFEIARTMYANLPKDEVLDLRPEIRYSRKAKQLAFGSTAKQFQMTGDMGLNSSILVDTAGEVESGRGFTFNSLHLSELAFWPDSKKKLTALANTVPDEPNSIIIIESTANGHNHFKTLWDAAEAGENEYEAIFFPWHEHPDYTRPFLSDDARGRFEEELGTGEYGEGEEMLIDRFGLTLEQLHWRRWAIANRCQGDLQIFQQEFPADPEEAFMSSGDRVFSTPVLMRVLSEVKQAAEETPAQAGHMEGKSIKTRKGQHGSIDVPVDPLWTPQRRGDWNLWPDPAGEGKDDYEVGPVKDEQYVIGCDVSGGERSDETADPAWHAISIINHTSRAQVAEYTSRTDEHILARQLFLMGHWFNMAWIVVEITGGWGGPVANLLWQDFGYPLTYTRPLHGRRFERSKDRLGWDTTPATKPILEVNAKELLRGDHGIRSLELVGEMLTYVKLNERGKTGPTPGSFSDRLIAWMLAQQIANEKPLRRMGKDRDPSKRRTRSYYSPGPYG